ncbi:MAG: peptidase G2 autoproteolytic cleavage domain-containing protein, partial [Candidatus Saccharimonadales bacterium]
GTNQVMTSPDGITWTARSAAANQWSSVTYDNGLFVAVSYAGTNRVMTSGDIALTTRGSVQVTGDISSTGEVRIAGSVNSTGLNVVNQVSQGYVATISNSSSDTNADGLLIKLGVANASRTTGNYFIGFSDAAGTVAGKIQGGASAVAYTTTGADYAEYFKADPANMPQPGELVSLDPVTANGVKLAMNGQMAMGVVSTNPGFVGNGPLCQVNDEDCDANYAKSNALVSLVGQVPLKVTGEVSIGDMLGASDIPGVAQKVTSGSYVGYALTVSENGTVQVLIRPGTHDSLSSVQGGGATFSSLLMTGPSTMESLVVTGEAEFKGNLTVVGTLETSDIIINGHLMTGGPTPSVTVGAVLNHSASELSLEGTDGAGTLAIKSGGGTTLGVVSHIEFAKQYTGAYKVVLSPVNGNAADIRVYVVKTANGFDLVTKDVLVPGEVYEFDYIVVGVKSLE